MESFECYFKHVFHKNQYFNRGLEYHVTSGASASLQFPRRKPRWWLWKLVTRWIQTLALAPNSTYIWQIILISYCNYTDKKNVALVSLFLTSLQSPSQAIEFYLNVTRRSLSFQPDKTIRGTIDVFPLQPVTFQFQDQLLCYPVTAYLYKR